MLNKLQHFQQHRTIYMNSGLNMSFIFLLRSFKALFFFLTRKCSHLCLLCQSSQMLQAELLLCEQLLHTIPESKLAHTYSARMSYPPGAVIETSDKTELNIYQRKSHTHSFSVIANSSYDKDYKAPNNFPMNPNKTFTFLYWQDSCSLPPSHFCV